MRRILCALFTVAALPIFGASTYNQATNAVVTTSYVSAWENLQAIKDGRDPSSSTDKTGGACTATGRPPAQTGWNTPGPARPIRSG
ncbi:MAG: hypothetical protein QM813_00980 [Verrucomicrobiota bacterium]